jgi:hypothetical protein
MNRLLRFAFALFVPGRRPGAPGLRLLPEAGGAWLGPALRSAAALLVLAAGPGCGDDAGGMGDDDDDDMMMFPDGGPGDDDDGDSGMPMGDDDDDDDDDDEECGRPFLAPSSDGIRRGFEGQQSWVVSLDVRRSDEPFENYRCASVESQTLAGPEIVAQKCNAVRCGVVMNVPDIEPNGRGLAWPTLENVRGVFLQIVSPATEVPVQVRVNFAFLDRFDAAADADLDSGPVRVVSGIDSSGVTFDVQDDTGFRLFSMSGGTFGATVDVSGEGQAARGGGFPGGPPLEPGAGPGGGGAGSMTSGGGGGGHLFPGDRGTGGDNGGAATAGPFGQCLGNALEMDCGGGGGGGQIGPGAGGGGVISIVSLGALDLSGGAFLASGGTAPPGTGGGGGAGGGVLIAAPSWDAPDEIDVSRGFGGLSPDNSLEGGPGSPGIIRVDVPGAEWRDALPGLAVDLPEEPTDYLVEDPAITLTGFAEPGSVVCATDLFLVEERSLSIAQAMTCAQELTGPDGRFSLDLVLRPGLNRLLVQSGSETGVATSWTGNSFRFDSFDFGPEGEEVEVFAPVAGLIDYVYVPDDERF